MASSSCLATPPAPGSLRVSAGGRAQVLNHAPNFGPRASTGKSSTVCLLPRKKRSSLAGFGMGGSAEGPALAAPLSPGAALAPVPSPSSSPPSSRERTFDLLVMHARRQCHTCAGWNRPGSGVAEACCLVCRGEPWFRQRAIRRRDSDPEVVEVGRVLSPEDKQELLRILGEARRTRDQVAEDEAEAGAGAEAEAKDLKERKLKAASGWRKVRSVVQWTPFIQTYKHKKYQWVQLAGHSGNFKPGQNQGTVLKKRCPKEELCYEQFIGDSLADYVPRFQGTVVSDDDEKFIQLQDCLSSFNLPSIMDCKIGVRTYLEEELAKAKEKPKLRKDMYEKMVLVDPTAPTEYEHQMKGVTKPRYMVWRETISSTATLGFRLEGVKRSDGTSSKDFKTTKTRQQVTEAFHSFLAGSVETAKQYLVRLKEINEALKVSKFFKTHELIGSSLLFVHDAKQASIWLIDFGKTVPVPDGLSIDHRSPWEEGNHEDGYMIGVENLVSIFGELAAGRTTTTTPSEPGRAPAENAAALAAGRTSRSAAESVAVPAETGASVAAPAAPREDLSAAK